VTARRDRRPDALAREIAEGLTRAARRSGIGCARYEAALYPAAEAVADYLRRARIAEATEEDRISVRQILFEFGVVATLESEAPLRFGTTDPDALALAGLDGPMGLVA
jgi:hypothetical protein